MKRLSGRSASPIAAVAAMVAFLATGCAGGQAAPSGAASPTSPVGGPTLTPTVRPSQSDAATGPSASPSPTPTPLLWTEASLKEDWPAPVRGEPAGDAIVVPIQDEAREVIPDRLGDTGSAAHPWVDIRELRGSGVRITINLGSLPPFLAPSEQWIAYGVVVDDDRDGTADRRFGIDNIPSTAPENVVHRAWLTYLDTGRTVVGNSAGVDGIYFETWYPGEFPAGDLATRLWFGGGDLTGGGTRPGGLVDPFYVWASVIVDGRVVATDYAPDVGWLVESKP